MKLRIALYSAVCALAAVSANAAAIVDNGSVQLGIDDFGQLNPTSLAGPASPVSGTTVVGLRHVATGNESTSHGCLCEGWGVGIGETLVSGSANNNFGVSNLTADSFVTSGAGTLASSTGSSATSTVSLTSGELSVTHAFAPSADTADLYEVTVSITNTSGADIADLRYTRTFDWDVEPTTFSDVVTIKGTATTTDLLASSNNGFVNSDPFASRSTIGGAAATTDLMDFGPTDQGTNFDFGFGALADGATKEFKIYYGATATEAAALAALGAVGAELYSFGQASSDPLGTGSGGGFDTTTFIFAFKGVGGKVIVPPAVIPVPAAGWLLIGGLGLLAGVRRRKKAA
ncbi:VPLPA-CTERM sorting domain-containing protein [Antarctobacter jejuensis]|uniref:VPLPA-CTERM sorting domain-containing protein n=1 Tax=Antarctobacter jejuensis TaxID=1439938 RepID=UPI003FD0C7BB